MDERKGIYQMISNKKKYKIGYTQGTFDMFHIGHLNLLRNAKKECEYLIVGINTDELVAKYKNKKPVINEENRLDIVKSIKFTDKALLVSTLDKSEIHKQLEFEAIFIGDDWKGNERWKQTEENLKKVGAEVVYLNYTKGVCSTSLRGMVEERIEE